MLAIGDALPNLDCVTQIEESCFAQLLGGGTGILFSFPDAFDAVALTELGEMARLKQEWEDRGVKVAALVCAPVGSVQGFVVDVKAATGFQIDFPIICDESKALALKLGLIKEDGDSSMRGVTFSDADFKVAMNMNYPTSCGTNFHEVLRIVDSLHITDKHQVWTPVNWVRGQDVMVGPEVDELKADKQHENVQTIDLPSAKNYLRVVRDPSA
ncbi:hypothetical protein TrCOL_g5053 [Triparma columacea]|uniref:Uncharacterized protein n=1 Tax=Triparma columacea TaxID=722753 RepID=A0A9W7G452_9STRA|nr:hypothetical protein TrCOL_g5053 [Triparma columacea]